jgi:hypothetical protein
MTQAARVALWVPTTAPPQTGDAILTTGAPAGAQAPVPTAFQLPAASAFATDPEIVAGAVTAKGINPLGLRNEITRLFANVLDLTSGILATATGPAPNMVVKTGADGLLASSLIPASGLPAIIDAGTF